MLGALAVVMFGLVYGFVSLTRDQGVTGEPRSTRAPYSMENSRVKLNDLYDRLHVATLTPKKDGSYIEGESAAVLPDISEYPFVVNPATADFLTVYASLEKAGDGYVSWLADMAAKFNDSGVEVDGKPVSVGIRSIPSGLGAAFIASGKYKPDIFVPSNELWGDMLVGKGVKVRLIEKRLAGNVAGIVLFNKKNDELIQKHDVLNAKIIADSVLAGELFLGYADPLYTSEGLNFIMAMLYAFDADNPLSEASVSQLRQFQDHIPYVSSEATQLKGSALSGTLDGFVSDYQTYVNSPELQQSYLFTPIGVRHDQPVYEIGELSELKKQIAMEFVHFSKTQESQKAAADKGFNGLDDYAHGFANQDGATVLQAQETWKKEKNGTRDLTAVFVADVSGSMDGSPLLKLKASLNRSAALIDLNTNIGLVTFSDEVSVALPIAKFDSAQKAYFSNAVRSMTAGGGTAMFDAVVVAQKMLIDAQSRNPNTKLMLFVLTDGESNRGYEFEDIENIVQGLRIPVYTIGYNANIDVLQSLSDINEATTMNADTDDVIYKLQSLFNAQM